MTQYKYYFLSLILVIADQLTKMMVLGSLKLYESIEITSFFSLTHVHNYGAAFSFLADEDGWQQYFLVSISVIASIAIILWMSKTSTKQPYKLIALSLILSGAIGNLIDRAVFGFVIDFINLHYQDFYWPVFNVADTAITLGVILLLLVDFKQDKAKS
ncbi:MAG: signal peptidase II [Candidatus Thioglobus sp.]|uniref:signal peptidase II n=1 Tax=Candidatus Thioglobus sp. TaxID=2026721 RepID=UPI0030B0720A